LPNSKFPPYVFLILATLFWAGNFTFGRLLSEALPPFGINLIRWIIACVVLIPLTLARERRIVPPASGQWPALVMMSVAGVLLFQSLVYLSLRFTTSSIRTRRSTAGGCSTASGPTDHRLESSGLRIRTSERSTKARYSLARPKLSSAPVRCAHFPGTALVDRRIIPHDKGTGP
jgi:hypothetical protein